MSFVANGLELNPGDEVLSTNHEHVGGLCCWQLAAARRGISLRQLPIPPLPMDHAQIVDSFRRALTPRTRVLSVSHVNFTNGLIMPVRALVELARPRGIAVVVDGAHPPGMMPVDLRALDADFYASSPHKWLLAPQGSGCCTSVRSGVPGSGRRSPRAAGTTRASASTGSTTWAPSTRAD